MFGIRVAGLGAMFPPSLAFLVHLLVRPRASFRSLIATAKASAKSWLWHHFLPSRYFSGLTAPQAFPRLDRRMQTPTRAGHVKAGRSSRPPKAWPLHDRARRHAGSIGACFSSSLYFASRSNIRLCRVHRSLRGRGSRRTMAFEGFDAAMSRTRSPECRGRNRAVVEARPDRDDVSLPRGREWV